MDLKPGIPTRDQYFSNVQSGLFSELEFSSNLFLREFPIVTETGGWVWDPFHQWSRQWEYPFVSQSISRHFYLNNVEEPAILDTGSGMTFFPYFLKQKFSQIDITCCDCDQSLRKIFETVNEGRDSMGQVVFTPADLRHLPFEDNSFDVVYSISVPEHAENYTGILSELNRILRPGGLFIVTFDIGLDGVSDIPLPVADNLNQLLARVFDGAENPRIDPGILLDGITSNEIGLRSPALLPWKYPLLSFARSAVKRRCIPNQLRKNLTVYCGRYPKR